ncbi:TIGR00375 family protein [Alicyclobacillus sp. SO9]|nr:TIGR00375 family protein [Alicyclobacillus sp. SO9]
MKTAYADFHIHIGFSHHQPVKITAAKNLTLKDLLEHALHEKGLQIVTVIDGVCPSVQADFQSLIDMGQLELTQCGGYLYQSRLLAIPGAEVEISGPQGGAAHFGCWFPTLAAARDFSMWLATVQTNVNLSSQKARTTAAKLQEQVDDRNGIFVVHHAFTPHKGLYGSCVNRLSEILDTDGVDAIELGLSANTDMADSISELSDYTFLTNSDAHSLAKIAREYNALHVDEDLSFEEVRKALRREMGRAVAANYGLEPKLGKYHRTTCNACGEPCASGDTTCRNCGSSSVTKGVYDRWLELRDLNTPQHPSHRPPYQSQIPLEFVPGLGPKTRVKLIETFGSEMKVLHEANETELADTVGEKLAYKIIAARDGNLRYRIGGGGTYGKVIES